METNAEVIGTFILQINYMPGDELFGSEYEDGFQITDGIERTVFNFDSCQEGKICMFERNVDKNIVKITLYYEMTMFEDMFNGFNIIVPFEKIRLHKTMSMLYDMSCLLTEDTKWIKWDQYEDCFTVNGRKLWKGKQVNAAIQPISFIYDYDEVWKDIDTNDQSIKESFEFITMIFNGEKSVSNLINIILEYNIDMLEKEVEEISKNIRRLYINKSGIDRVGKIIEEFEPHSDISKDITTVISQFL
jgi:hypothetical protein